MTDEERDTLSAARVKRERRDRAFRSAHERAHKRYQDSLRANCIGGALLVMIAGCLVIPWHGNWSWRDYGAVGILWLLWFVFVVASVSSGPPKWEDIERATDDDLQKAAGS